MKWCLSFQFVFFLPWSIFWRNSPSKTRVNEPSWLVVQAPSALKNLFVKIGSLEPSFCGKNSQKEIGMKSPLRTFEGDNLLAVKTAILPYKFIAILPTTG